MSSIQSSPDPFSNNQFWTVKRQAVLTCLIEAISQSTSQSSDREKSAFNFAKEYRELLIEHTVPGNSSGLFSKLKDNTNIVSTEEFNRIIDKQLAIALEEEHSEGLLDWMLEFYFYDQELVDKDGTKVEIINEARLKILLDHYVQVRIEEIRAGQDYRHDFDPIYQIIDDREFEIGKNLSTNLKEELIAAVVDSTIEFPDSRLTQGIVGNAIFHFYGNKLDDLLDAICHRNSLETACTLLYSEQARQTISPTQLKRITELVVDDFSTDYEDREIAPWSIFFSSFQSDPAKIFEKSRLVEIASKSPKSTFTRKLLRCNAVKDVFSEHQELYQELTQSDAPRHETTTTKKITASEQLAVLEATPNDRLAYNFSPQDSFLNELSEIEKDRLIKLICTNPNSLITCTVFDITELDDRDRAAEFDGYFASLSNTHKDLVIKSALANPESYLAMFVIMSEAASSLCQKSDLQSLVGALVKSSIEDPLEAFLNWQREYGQVRSFDTAGAVDNVFSGISNMLEIANVTDGIASPENFMKVLSNEGIPATPDLPSAVKLLDSPNLRALLSAEQISFLQDSILDIWKAPKIYFLQGFFENLTSYYDIETILGQRAEEFMSLAVLDPPFQYDPYESLGSYLFEGNLRNCLDLPAVKRAVVNHILVEPNSDYVEFLLNESDISKISGNRLHEIFDTALANPASKLAWAILAKEELLNSIEFKAALTRKELAQIDSNEKQKLLRWLQHIAPAAESILRLS